MKVCIICVTEIESKDIFSEYEIDEREYDESIFGNNECYEKTLCKERGQEVYVMETTEIYTMEIDNNDFGI